MRTRFPLLLTTALVLAATPAAAQHCWPSAIALFVRDARGGLVDPRPLMDSLQYAPRRLETADFVVRVVLIHPDDTNSSDRPGGTPAITWYGQGDCRIDMREVVLRRGPVVMRLWVDLHVDTQARPGSSTFLLKTPPFATGTWRLDVCRLPDGQTHVYAPIPTRWVRVSESGDPGTPWQPPQRCAREG
jgi:hypothetical protein